MAVYSAPEKFGLEIVTGVDFSDGNYQFDLRMVWRHKETGKFYTQRDAGCSCSPPFDDCETLEDLEELTDMIALRQEIQEMGVAGASSLDPTEAQDFLRTVEKAMGEETTC